MKKKSKTLKKKHKNNLKKSLKKSGGKKSKENYNRRTITPFNRNEHITNNTTIRSNSNNNDIIHSNNQDFNIGTFHIESHNCYSYFLDLKSKEAIELCKKELEKNNYCRRSQPGYLSGFSSLSKNDYNCKEIEKRTLKDNPEIYKLNSINDNCKSDFYKGAMVVAPNRDYHYYRYNDDNTWSHKPGYKPSTIYDANNKKIINPQDASRDYGGTLNYSDFCGYYCVPRNKNKKNMYHLHNKNNNDDKYYKKLTNKVKNILSQ